MKKLFCIAFLFMATTTFAVQYQAAQATLSGGATLSGDYVQMKEGSMSWTVNVSSAGMYDIVVRYMQDYDASKEQHLEVGGTKVGTIAFPRATSWTDVTTVARLASGNNTIAITNSWGWVDIMYIDVKPYQNTPFDLDKNLVNANANDAAKKMFAFMQEKFQKKIISGVMTADVINNNNNNPLALYDQPEVKHIRTSSSNKTPALVGFDFMHGTGKEYNDNNGGWNLHYTNATIALAKELYQKGGIPHYCWHWRDPLKKDKGFYSPSSNGSDKTDFDLTKACASASCTAWNTSSNEYKGMVEDIDKVADYLKQLQEAGVAVLWRPIHEASGGWFWWGYKGAEAFKLLYELIYTRLTNHHNLNNLIWVWNSEGADPDWYPGDNRVDIIGRDTYVDNHGSLIGEFEKLKNLFGTKKMIALSENGPVPYPKNLVDDNAGWSFFMPWYGQYTTQQNTASDWQTIMSHDYVITLEDMPGWGAYEPPPPSSSSNAPSSSSNNISSSSSGAEISPILNSQAQILNSNVTYYSIQGIPLGETKPIKSGVYIVKEKHSIKKIVVR